MEEIPLPVQEALSSPDAIFWRETVYDEIDSLHSNKTWKLVDLPPGCKLLGVNGSFVKNLNRMEL